MRSHFALCLKRLAGSDEVDRPGELESVDATRAALRRYGIPASAPMFIPFFGAFIIP
jgi:hypothetical protein